MKLLTNTKQYMISTTELADFRIGFAALEESKNSVVIEPATAEAMRLQVGDVVRFIEA